MKMRLLGAALAVCLAGTLTGCSNAPAGGGSSAGGSLALSKDDALLYAADPDLDTVFVVDTKTQALVRQVAVGRMPEKLLVAPDDTIYVANRLDRSVSVLRPGETTEAARLATAVEPVGLAVSSDAKTLYVVNATSLTDSEFGTLMAFDTETRQLKWETPVGREPRGITLLGDGRAAVSLFKDGDLVYVDTAKGEVIKSGTDVFSQLNRMTLGLDVNSGGPKDAPVPEPFPGFALRTARPRGVETLLTSRDGTQVFATSLISTDGILATGSSTDPVSGPTDPSSAGYGGGSCGATAVAAPALLTFSADGQPLVDDLATCGGDGSDTGSRPPTLLTSNIPGMPIQGPRAMTLDPTGTFVFVANFDSNNVAIVPTSAKGNPSGFGVDTPAPPPDRSNFGVGGSVTQLVNVGAGPSGIAVSRDGTKAFVFNAFDHSVSLLEQVNGRVSNTRTVTLGADPATLTADAAAGRRLFFSATDARMNNPSTGISCGTCHLEGREDGHVWNFPDGPRQTPSLSGRMLTKTAPFHWSGEFNDLLAFMSHTVQRRMGGSGVTPAMEQQVAAFIDSMPAPDSPYKDLPADVIARGKAAFDKAQCGTCHVGETLTNQTFADVGTYVTVGSVTDHPELLPHGGLNTPSLLGLARTAPYLHDGSAQTLKARILQGKAGDRHGITSQLTDAEVDDLVSYLRTL